MLQEPLKLMTLLFAALLIVGCTSHSQAPAPASPSGSGPEAGSESGSVSRSRSRSAPVADQTSDDPSVRPSAPSSSTFNNSIQPFYPGTSQLLERVFYFDFDRAIVSAADLEALQVHTEVLRNNPSRRVVIEGHCDERGTREYNLALGERRADAVRSFLTAAGVSSSRIETVSYGEERPDDPGQGEDAWARNRRAVMIYR